MPKWTKPVALLLAFALLVPLAGCASDAMTVLAKVNGQPIYRWQLMSVYNDQKDIYEQSQNIDLSLNENYDKRVEYLKTILDQLIQNTAAIEKAKQMGLDLTEEERATANAEIDAGIGKIIDYYASQYLGQQDAHEKGVKDWQKSLSDAGIAESEYRRAKLDEYIHAKLAEQLYVDVKPDEETIKTYYDNILEAQQTTFEQDPSAFAEQARIMNGGIEYIPEGFTRVKYVFIQIPDEILEQVNALGEEYTQLFKEYMAMMQEKGEVNAESDPSYKRMLEVEKEIDNLRVQGRLQVAGRAKEASEAIKNGMSFDEAIVKYSDEPEIAQAPYNTTGILVSSKLQLDGAFIQAADSLETPGAVSQALGGDTGYYIVQLLEKLTPGIRPLEGEVYDYIVRATTLAPRQEVLDEFRKQAAQEFKIERYESRIR